MENLAIMALRNRTTLSSREFITYVSLFSIYAVILKCIHEYRKRNSSGLGRAPAPFCAHCPEMRTIAVKVRRGSAALDEDLHRCPRCGRVRGPGIWEEFQEIATEEGGKTGVLGALLNAKRRLGMQSHPARGGRRAACPPSWVESARRPPPPANHRPPLWDRWLDG